MKRYAYVGPAALAHHAGSRTPRARIAGRADAAAWLNAQPDVGRDGTVTATFVVTDVGLWVADRHSEHAACSRGRPVLSGGEITFVRTRSGPAVTVVYVTNPSTGYCPEPESWPAVAAVLDAADIPHPGGFTAELTFRRCPRCGSTNIVKDGWFACNVCDAPLPAEWNFAGAE